MAAIQNVPSSPIAPAAEPAAQAQVASGGRNEGFSQALSQEMEKKQVNVDSKPVAASNNPKENQSVRHSEPAQQPHADARAESADEPAVAQQSEAVSTAQEADTGAVASEEIVPLENTLMPQHPGLQQLLGLVGGRAEGGKELPLLAKPGHPDGEGLQGITVADIMRARQSLEPGEQQARLSSPEQAGQQEPAVEAEALLTLQQRVEHQLVMGQQTAPSEAELKSALQGVERALQALSRGQADGGADIKGLEQAREQLLARLQGLQGQGAQSQSQGGNGNGQQANPLAFLQAVEGEEAGKLPEAAKLTRVAFQEMLAQQQLASGTGSAANAQAAAGLQAGPAFSMNSLTAMLSPADGNGQVFNYAQASSSVNLPVNHPAWGQAIGERLQWMVKQNLQEAQIKLNPRNMGPIEIKIAMNQDQATVSFVANHAMTRDALDAAVPRLREMFGDSGLNLVDVNVSQNPDTRGQRADENGRQGMGGSATHALDNGVTEAGEDLATTVQPTQWYGSNSVLDAYA